jgi:excisionase family DNA binding protein
MNDQLATCADLGADEAMMTLIEVAEYLRVQQVTIYRAIKSGEQLGQFRVGRSWRFRREVLLRFANG